MTNSDLSAADFLLENTSWLLEANGHQVITQELEGGNNILCWIYISAPDGCVALQD